MAGRNEKRKTAEQELVVTPGGPRSKGLVHPVRTGEAVDFSEALPQGAGEAVPKAGKGMVLTPGGYRQQALVRQVEPGHGLQMANGRMHLMNLATKIVVDTLEQAILPEEEPGPPLGSGWIAYAYWNNGTGTPLSSFRTTWQVPPAPASPSSQVIFLFNGIQNYGINYGILQPVLQWGVSAAGGGPYWSVASWYVTSGGQAFHTPLVPVASGSTLVGVMTLTGQSGGLFSYTSEFQGIAGTSLPIQNIAELLWCNQTLEAYSVTRCSNYPNTLRTAFQAIDIRTGGSIPTVNWTPVNRITDCGQHVLVVEDSGDGGEVDIYYHSEISVVDFGRFAEYVQVLFGVTNDGGGAVIINGHIIRIPPFGPPDPILHQVTELVTELVRSLSVREVAKGSSNAETRQVIEKASRDIVVSALEQALKAVK